MLKKILLASIFVITAISTVAHAESDLKTVASKAYVDTQIETKQLKIPAAGQPNVGAGETVMTYTATGNGQIGERGLYSDISSYDATTDGDKLITASALNATFTNLPTTPTTKLECANQADGCTLWTIVDQTAYARGLPDGYTFLDSIIVDGAYFVTNLYPTLDTDFEIDFQKNTDSLVWLFGTREYPDGTTSAIINKFGVQVFSTFSNSIWVQIDNTSSLEYGTVAVTSGQADRLARHRIRFYQGNVFFDGAPVNWANYVPDASAFTAGNPLVIGNNYASDGTFSNALFRGTIYGATGFKPCLRISDNVAGLWDVENGVFIEKSGGGTVTAGNPINN